jgi:Family of unknown function (DUF6252)
MNTLKNTFAILFILILTISCSNNDDSSSAPTTPTADYFFKAKIDGAQYTANALQVVAGITGSSRKTLSVICATSTGNFDFNLNKAGTIETGTYTVGNLDDDIFFNMYYGNMTTTSFAADVCDCDGTLTITAISATEVSGTFSFTAKKAGQCSQPAKVISEGSFKSRM